MKVESITKKTKKHKEGILIQNHNDNFHFFSYEFAGLGFCEFKNLAKSFVVHVVLMLLNCYFVFLLSSLCFMFELCLTFHV